MKIRSKQLFMYSTLVTILVVITPVTSFQEEITENSESKPVEKIIRILGTEENSVSPNIIYVRTFDVITFVNLDGTDGGTTHTIVSVKKGNTEPDGTFASGLIKTGKNFKFIINEPGIYEYYDPESPIIRGTIHVV